MPPLVFVSPEGEIMSDKHTRIPQPVEDITSYEWDMEQLRKQAAEQAAKDSTHKKVTE